MLEVGEVGACCVCRQTETTDSSMAFWLCAVGTSAVSKTATLYWNGSPTMADEAFQSGKIGQTTNMNVDDNVDRLAVVLFA